MNSANRLWRTWNDESGQALVLGVLCMALLMGVMALTIDVGYIHYRQVQLQTAADSAAIAAGLENQSCNNIVCSYMETAAAQALIEDGITSATITPSKNKCTVPTSAGLSMIINVAPCVLGSTTNDPNYGNPNMVEVVLTEPVGAFFGNLFGIPTFNLQARAEAGEAYYLDNVGGNCVYTKSLSFNSSNGIFTLTACGIYDGGNLGTDSGVSVTASSFLYDGFWGNGGGYDNCAASGSSSCTWTLGDSETQPTKTTTPQNDPLQNLQEPSQPAISSTNTQTPNNGATLQPGYYPNGFNLNSNVSVTLNPGVYYMGGSINVDGGASLIGTGVTLYFANGSLQPNSSNSVVQITAPTTSTNGQNANMAVWESSTNSSGMDLDANSTTYINGVVYLPDATLTLNSGSGNVMNAKAAATALDVNSLIVNSNITLEINGSQSYLGGGGPTLGAFALAE